MARIYSSVTDLMGSTPVVELKNLGRDLGARLLVKLEGCNPAGSAKDRVALSMIEDAVQRGILAPGGLIIEPTSGNTGIGLCAVAAARGYRCCIVMPDSMSPERRKLMAAYGAEVVLTPGKDGMAGAIARAEALKNENPGSFLAGQFDNPANALAHYRTTGPEIWADTDGAVDLFVAGIGTGGTITGVGRYLKEKNPQVEILGLEPAGSPVLTRGISGKHGLQGIGAGFVPGVLDRSVVDRVVTCTEEDAYACARSLARQEGILCGISGGAALWAALQECAKPENTGKTVLALLPDTGERYLSTDLFV